jgi:hypothetical protein
MPPFAGLFRARLEREDVDSPHVSDSGRSRTRLEVLALSACGRTDGVGGGDRLVRVVERLDLLQSPVGVANAYTRIGRTDGKTVITMGPPEPVRSR